MGTQEWAPASLVPSPQRIVNPLTTMFVGRCYIIGVRIITDIFGLEGGVSVGEITASRGLVEAHQRPVLQGLNRHYHGRGP